MSKFKTKNKARAERILKLRLFSGLFFVLLVLGGTYFTLLGISIKSVVMRKDMQAQIAKTRVEIAQMEHEYLQRAENINHDSIAEVGLVDIHNKSFAERRVLVGQAN